MRPKLIIVNGLPATGKSTLASYISSKTSIASISKDELKEFLFDKLGKSLESSNLGVVSTEILYMLAGEFLANNKSIIIENAFMAEFAKPRLERLIRKHNPLVLEIYCTTEVAIRHQRYKKRNENGNRHPVHVDVKEHLLVQEPELYKKYEPLKVGKMIEVDTTEPSKINLAKIVSRINNLS